MVGRHRIVVFYLLTYAISWIPGFTYGALVARGQLSSPAIPFLLLAASYGPTLAALFMLALLREPDETRAFRRHLGAWRAGLGWYALALVLPAGLWAAGSLLAASVFGGSVVFVAAAAAAFPALLLANAGEEIGWRGFAFPHLLAVLRPLPASLVFGALWAGIHLPLYIGALDRFAVLLPLFLGLSVLMAWIYLHTGQGVLPLLLFHASLDTSQFILPLDKTGHGTQTFAAIAALSVAAALGVLWRTRGELGLVRADARQRALASGVGV